MPIGVVRVGGSSLQNKTFLSFLFTELKQTKQPLVLVVSAIPEIQKSILNGLKGLLARTIDHSSIISEIRNEILFDKTSSSENAFLEQELSDLEALLNGIQLTGDYSDALKDAVLSFSEKITVHALSAWLNAKGLNNGVFYPEEFQFLVTEEYGNASVLKQNDLLSEKALRNTISLIPGSFGVTEAGKIARLGLQAADYSAAAITRLLGAERLEIWEPDHLFYSGDPRIVRASQVLSRLTYEEASELSYFSESSLHPRFVEPLIDEHIQVHVFRLTEKGRQLETIINTESVIAEKVVKSVVCDDHVAILKLNGAGVGFKPGILAKVTGAFHQAGINIRSVITSQVSINIILDRADAKRARIICQGISLSSVNELQIHDRVSLIAVVGHGMLSHHGVSARLFQAVASQKINVLLSGSGASDLVSYLVVDQNENEKAIREIHQVFLEE